MSLLGQYKYIIDKTHPRANSEGAVYEHMIIAEEKLGRHLFPEEVVHHIDFNKMNNDTNNLMVFASNGDHSRFHMNGCKMNGLSINSNGAYVYPQSEFKCIDCGAEITRWGVRCRDCHYKHSQKIERPQSNELHSLLIKYKGNFTKVGKMYGVSDNAVRKWCNSYGIPSKSKDYREFL